MLSIASDRFRDEMEQYHAELVTTVAHELRSSYEQHDKRTFDLLSALERAVHEDMEIGRSDIADMVTNLATMIHYANTQWNILHSQIELLQEV